MTKLDKFVNEAIRIAKDNSHGYDQLNRWGKDYDCSSLVYTCAYVAGYDVPKTGTRYTGTILNHFTKCGWRADQFDGNLSDLDKGDILLNVQNHVAIYIGNGQIVEASINENNGIAGGKVGDQTGHEIHIRSVYNYPWNYVLTAPAENATTTKPNTSTKTKKAELVELLEKALKIAKGL